MLRFNKVTALVAVLVIPIIIFSIQPSVAHAVTGSDWQAGRIIDDGVFYNNGSMSANDVQAFLNSQVPSCDTQGNQIISGNQTRAQYGTSRGFPPPYVCLKNYVENPSTRVNNLGGGTVPGGASAASIIKGAADQYQINPKVLIVTLQKENSLVTDDWPWSSEYKTAMGYGCPDTAACDTQYFGFYNQVMNAARQFRLYASNSSDYRYKPYQSNYVQYNPNAGCGGTNVNITNTATAGLYNYTPYQPNQSALNNLYGSGDSCGAYGNRNFWRLFNDWFGSTLSVPYAASNYLQSPNYEIYPGQTYNTQFSYKNIGSYTWLDDVSSGGGVAVHLATTNPINRSGYFTSGWPSANRPAKKFFRVYESNGSTLSPNQNIVQPGQIAVFQFPITIPNNTPPGTYTEYVQPVAEGSPNWNMLVASSINITVKNPYGAKLHRYSTNAVTVNRNDKSDLSVSYQNVGYMAWKDQVSAQPGETLIDLATNSPVGRGSGFSAGWPHPSRPTKVFNKVYEADGVTLAANQHVAQAGQIVEFKYPVTYNYGVAPGSYIEPVQPIAEGSYYWDLGQTFTPVVTQSSTRQSAAYSGQSVYPTLAQGESVTSFVRFTNTGSNRWYDDTSVPPGLFPIHLATDNPVNRNSATNYQWPAANRPNKTFSKVYEADGVTLAASQNITQPGQIVEFSFMLKNYSIPPGSLSREWFTPIAEGAPDWRLTDQQVWLDVKGK